MIDPVNGMVRYNLSKEELEETILFAICVAGKTAPVIARALDRMLKQIHSKYSVKWMQPFKAVRRARNELSYLLRDNGIGCFNFKSKSILDLVDSNLDLESCTVEDLENVYGIGPKTSRFFVLFTRRNVELACLDVHILSYLKDLGYKVPKNTPTGKKYKEIERIFIDLAKKAGKSVVDFDYDIWKRYRRKVVAC